MKKKLLNLVLLMAIATTSNAINDNTVEIVYNGTTATITIANNISSYITDNSDGSSHVKLIQSESFTGIDPDEDNEDGEITYVLKGTSSDGEFYLEGSFKATIELNGVTLTNPSGPAINIQDGKRIAISVKNGTSNNLTDGVNDTYNGCLHCKGHTKFKGKGTLNVVGNSKHAIYSKEYIEVKNCTININAAEKDAIHCKEYFLMESGAVTIKGAVDDGIQVELSNGSEPTGTTSNHDDENSGNFYQQGGTLSISNYGGKAIKVDGSVKFAGGKQNFDTSDVETATDIEDSRISAKQDMPTAIYDLQGHKVSRTGRNLYIFRSKDATVKRIIK